jgi:4-amino-4-deoxy-L-arabinose transferase
MKKHSILLLLAFYLLVYILPIGALDLFTPDETRYAEIPREMITSGDWAVPHLNGLRYFEKPVFGYWVHAISLLFFGENNFAVRLPSVISTGFTALLIFILVRRISHDQDENMSCIPAFASLIFLSCFEVFGVGNIAVLDNLFSFFLTVTITAFYFASEARPGSSGEKVFLALSGVACGLAFLTKGFLAFAIPVLAVAPYLIWERRASDLIRMSWIPFLTAILVALPWSILIHMREPDYWNFFFWNEHIRRFMGENSQHQKSFYYFILTSLGTFIPWVFIIPAAVKGLLPLITKEDLPQTRLIKFSISWLILPFFFLSTSNGKLLTYILPCFPPFAILMVFGLLNVLKNERRNIFKWGVSGVAVFFGLVLLALLYVHVIDFNKFHLFKQSWKVIMFANSLIVALIFCFLAIKSSKISNKILFVGLSPFLFFLIIHFVIPDSSIASKVPGVLLENYRNLSDDTIVISDENSITAVCWYFRRNNVYLLHGGGELDYGLAYPDASHRLIDIKSIAGFIKENRGRTVLIGRMRNLKRWKGQLPDPDSRDESGPEGYGLWRY